MYLQAPYQEVKYVIIGDDQAPGYFSIGENDGRITVRSSLNEDSAEVYKIRVEAYDGDSPPRSAIEIVTVEVDRNLNKPTFSRPPANDPVAEIEIKETESFQKTIYKMEAIDEDRRVSFCHSAISEINNTYLML